MLLAGFRTGSRLGGYRLEALVGTGGMAVVFRARDEALDRLVALKLLAPALASDEEFRVRFIAESRAAAAVDDPFIIPVYEAGEAGGMLFIAMRFVQGGDLRQLLDRAGALEPEQAAAFISPVASALDAAHRAGLVHRDVKPGNILIDTGENRPDHVYLSDFGVAKAVSEASLTGPAGYFVGTPDYAAPEQIRGQATGGRADQYALACVAFQLLTGDLPFRADQGPPVLLAHVTSPPPSLTARRPDLPGAVDQVMARAMAKDPAERYASCLDFAGALREALSLRPFDPEGPATVPPAPRPAASARDTISVAPPAVPGRGGGTAGRARPVTGWARRHRLPALALACAALAAAGAIASVLANPAASRSQAQPSAAAKPPPAAKPARPAGSASPTDIPGSAVSAKPVPIKLPPPYAGAGIAALALNPAGTTLAVADGKQVCLLNIAANRGCATSPALTVVNAVAFSPDGRTVAAGSIIGRIALLNVASMKLAVQFADSDGAGVQSLAFSPDGKTVAAADVNGRTYLWHGAAQRAVTLTDRQSKGVKTVVFSPDGKTIATGDLNGSVYLWNAASGKPIGTLRDPESKGVDSTAFSPDGATVAAGDFNGHSYLWDVATRSVAHTFTDPFTAGVNVVAFSPGSGLLTVADLNGAMFFWDTATRQLVQAVTDNKTITALVFTPDGKALVTGDLDGDLNLWNIS